VVFESPDPAAATPPGSCPPGGGTEDGPHPLAELRAGDGVDQVPQGAAEAVELPDDRVSPGRSWSRSCSRVGRSGRAPLAVSVNTR
jgi:hypothetical protein